MIPWKHYRDGITQIKFPLPFTLREVNCYLIRGSEGYTVIDPGLHTKYAEELWLAVFRELKMGEKHIEQIVLTHHHPDHYGMAGWLQQRTEAPVILSERAHRQAQLLWGSEQPMRDRLLELFARHGLPHDVHHEMTKHVDSFVTLVSPHPTVTVWAQPTVRLGNRVYEIIETSGHATGHFSFYDSETHRIFCGDHVLPHITPNVSFLPDVDANPLGAYLSSLHTLSKLDVSMAYPGHRDPWPHFALRANEIIAHHEARLRTIEQLLSKPHTAYEVCLLLFGNDLSMHLLRFALSETIAHLVYLHIAGRIQIIEEENIRYCTISRN